MINIYVGNMSYDLTEDQIQELFGQYGTVSNVRIITDRDTKRPKGFGFVEMEEQEEGMKAIDAINGKEVNGRELKVNEARPKESRPRRNDRY